MLEIRSNGALNSVQDLGRRGHLAIGVSQGGAMDRPALMTANALVGNADGAAAIEVCIFPFRVRFAVDTVFACTGADAGIRLDDMPVPPWWSRRAKAGQELVVAPPRRGARIVLAVAGGIAVDEVLGSRSTDLKAGFGGLEGRGLRKGDILPLGEAPGEWTGAEAGLGCVPADRPEFLRESGTGCVTVRVLAAAQFEEFGPSAVSAFLRTGYRITPDANRMGFRLAGQALERMAPRELLSHGIVPGTVQVPPSGQPIVQMAEANTCGGYPKIANVIETDLWRIAQAQIGQALHFELIEPARALALRQEALARHAALRRNLPLLARRA